MITLYAPFLRALFANVFPLKLAPFKAKKRQLLLMDLVSVQIPEDFIKCL